MAKNAVFVNKIKESRYLVYKYSAQFALQSKMLRTKL